MHPQATMPGHGQLSRPEIRVHKLVLLGLASKVFLTLFSGKYTGTPKQEKNGVTLIQYQGHIVQGL